MIFIRALVFTTLILMSTGGVLAAPSQISCPEVIQRVLTRLLEHHKVASSLEVGSSGYDLELVKRAINFASSKHASQIRKLDGRPYFDHPTRVAAIVKHHIPDSDLVAAALLHDVVEDTATSVLDIQKLFNPRVASLVGQVTSDTQALKAMGKPLYLARKLRQIDAQAFFLKLADRFDNLSDLHLMTPEKAAKYALETHIMVVGSIRPITGAQRNLLNKIIAKARTAPVPGKEKLRWFYDEMSKLPEELSSWEAAGMTLEERALRVHTRRWEGRKSAINSIPGEQERQGLMKMLEAETGGPYGPSFERLISEKIGLGMHQDEAFKWIIEKGP